MKNRAPVPLNSKLRAAISWIPDDVRQKRFLVVAAGRASVGRAVGHIEIEKIRGMAVHKINATAFAMPGRVTMISVGWID